MISIRQIRSFVAVYEEASFTTAAKREGATQSGLSQHIKQLEEELGAKLLERSKTQVTPTAAGAVYYRECVEVLRRLDNARQSIASGCIIGRSACRPDAGLHAIRDGTGPALFPRRRAALQHFSRRSLFRRFNRQGRRRIARFRRCAGVRRSHGISSRLLARDREVLVRARQQKNNHLKPIRLIDAAPLKLVLPGPQNTRRRNIETYLRTNGIEVFQRLELDAMMGTMQLIARSDWAAILPFSMVLSDIDRTVRGPPIIDPPFHSEFILIEPAQKALSRAAQYFAELLREETEKGAALFNARCGTFKKRT